MSELWEVLDPFNELALIVDEDAIGFFDDFMVQQFLIFCEFIYWEVEVQVDFETFGDEIEEILALQIIEKLSPVF